MRSSTLAATLAVAVAAGCSEHRLAPTAPDAPDASPTAQRSAAQSFALASLSAPQPGVGDHILFDTRASLQTATSLRQALKLFGYQSTRTYLAFTPNVDGQGTHALRVDWPAGTGCSTVSPSVAHDLETPHPSRVYFQWKQHMGRTATGGGRGNIGAFAIGNTSCSGLARDLWFARRDVSTRGASDAMTLEIRAARAPTVDVDISSTNLRLPSPGAPLGTFPIVGRDVVHTLYLQAESAPGKGDGMVQYWIDGTLMINESAAKIGAETFRRFAFPRSMRLSSRAQSEYFWNIVAWQPADTASAPPPPPPPLTAIATSPDSVTLAPGGTQKFSTVGVRQDGTKDSTVAVSYTATGGSITSDGAYTAGTTAGTFRVISNQTNGTFADTATVIIAVPAPTVQGIAIAPKSAALSSGGTQQYTVTLKKSDGTTSPPPANSVTYSATGGAISSSGLYTAGAAAGSFRVIASYTPPNAASVADTESVTVTQVVTSGSSGDPTQLPAASRQSPDYAHYVGGTLAAGQSYADAATGVRVWKLTDANTPLRNSGMSHDYSSGSVQVTRGWGATGTTHTVLMLQGGNHWFVDFTRGQGTSNWRQAPSGINSDLCFTFSYNPATPRIGYYLDGAVLKRYDAAANADAPQGYFPKDLSSAGGTLRYLWLQQDKNDGWFVMMPSDLSRVVAWNSNTNQMLVLTSARAGVPFNEPHLERDGRYVLISLNSAGWVSWDLVTDTFVHLNSTEIHSGGVRHFFASFDADLDNGPQWRYDPSTGTQTTIPNLSGQQGLSVYLQHRADQWVMSDQDLGGDLTKQWVLIDIYNDGWENTSWSLDAGEVYASTINYTYDQQRVGIKSVRQYVAGTTTQVASQLTAAASRAAMTEGSFYYDGTTRKLYVWAVGGGSPAGRVDPRVNGMIHDGLGLYRLDGSDLRLLAHHYELGTNYWATPRATISPDGKIALFDSNMNNSSGRSDTFLVEIPIR